MPQPSHTVAAKMSVHYTQSNTDDRVQSKTKYRKTPSLRWCCTKRIKVCISGHFQYLNLKLKWNFVLWKKEVWWKRIKASNKLNSKWLTWCNTFPIQRCIWLKHDVTEWSWCRPRWITICFTRHFQLLTVLSTLMDFGRHSSKIMKYKVQIPLSFPTEFDILGTTPFTFSYLKRINIHFLGEAK